jgi:hypothetical protein
MSDLGVPMAGRIIHHDQDSVYTSYRWLRAILLEDGLRVSYSKNGAKGNQGDPRSPGSNRSGAEPKPRLAHGSLRPRPCQGCETFSTSAFSTTTESGDTPRSATFHPENISDRLSILSNQNLKSLLRLSRN